MKKCLFLIFLIFNTSFAFAFEYKSILKQDLKEAKTIFTKKNLMKMGLFSAVFFSSMALDKTIKRDGDKNDTPATISDVGNVFGYAPFVFSVASGLHLIGLLYKNDKLAESSFTSIESLSIAGGFCHIGKTAFGRIRPKTTDSPFCFRPFRGYKRNRRSLPCGHVTMAWALVTPYAVYYHQPWLYTLPILTSFARIYDNEHWFSDTVLGTGIGFGVAYTLSKWHLNRQNKISIKLWRRGVCLSVQF